MQALEKIKDTLIKSFHRETYIGPIKYDRETKNYIFPPEITTLANKILRITHQCSGTSTERISVVTGIDCNELEPVIARLRNEGRIKTTFMHNANKPSHYDYHKFILPDPLPIRLAIRAYDALTAERK